MSQKLRIGLVLPALPSYSETFINNKINGLLENGNKVSLFVVSRGTSAELPESVAIYYQVSRYYHIAIIYK